MKTFARKQRNARKKMQEIIAAILVAVFIFSAFGFVGHSDLEVEKLEASFLTYK